MIFNEHRKKAIEMLEKIREDSYNFGHLYTATELGKVLDELYDYEAEEEKSIARIEELLGL